MDPTAGRDEILISFSTVLGSPFLLLYLCSDEQDQYGHGTYVQCRVLAGIPSQPIVEVSLRPGRLEGDLDDDELPEEKDFVQGFVIDTNKKGCFVRLARCVEGRVTLKELCDGFLPDPVSSFPMGRLVVGKVKSVRPHKPSSKKKKNAKDHNKATVDLDMRESVLLESQDKLMYEDVEVGSKHKGTVTRLESYGVFVRLDNSDVSGLAHKSECSDKYIKNLADLYDPGDLVKVLVVKKDEERKTIGFSLKASHFRDDVESDDDSSVGDEDSKMDEVLENALASDEEDDEKFDSDEENFVAKLAQRKLEPYGESSSESGEEESDGGSESSDESDAESQEEDIPTIDTNVGFDWGAGGPGAIKSSEEESSSNSSDDSSDEEEVDTSGGKASRKSRKKAAARRLEEHEISRRETALADGTADENPETAADFERLLATEPNRSEHWIRYMAYHLSLADVTSARNVAERAFDRIEVRQEREKLNVWTALLTLELKYGDSKGLQKTVDRACQQNNPKQVYLRLCELVEREVDPSGPSQEAIARTDEMYEKMCIKFKGKKTVWIAYLHYLVKSGRHQEAQALLKRALISLPQYKHVETMSKFAQLEMEHGSMERGRTVMDGLLAKYPKRLDLLFVYVDKEVKAREIKAARALLKDASLRKKLSDKQMKSLFKKWYRVEEEHGTEESREHVKDAARAYVERTK
jgi:rRNA biogenesis protein RRP5